jgi:hypothetical protein
MLPRSQRGLVPWDSWGPIATRWFKSQPPPSRPSFIEPTFHTHGSRVAFITGSNDSQIRVKDFNPSVIKAAEDRTEGGNSYGRVVRKKTVVKQSEGFEADIVSWLPFYETTSPPLADTIQDVQQQSPWTSTK